MTTAVAQMGATEARALTDQIKVAVEATWELVKRAYVERAWAVLGYDGWDDYCTREFGTSRLRLPREERAEVVASLRESGLSVRAIAAATGLSRGTIGNEVSKNGHLAEITGTDGKTYTPPAKPTTFVCWSCETTHPVEQATETDDGPLCGDCLDVYDRFDVTQPATPTPVTSNDLTPEPITPVTPPEPATPRRRPITEAFDTATFNLKRAVESVTRLAADDRLEKNKDQITGSNLSDLVRVRDAINGVINTLEG